MNEAIIKVLDLAIDAMAAASEAPPHERLLALHRAKSLLDKCKRKCSTREAELQVSGLIDEVEREIRRGAM